MEYEEPMEYDAESTMKMKRLHKVDDVRTWMYFPIVMPLKDGQGPASDKECDKITWEVWDQFMDTFGSFDNLPDAINLALKMNRELLKGS